MTPMEFLLRKERRDNKKKRQEVFLLLPGREESGLRGCELLLHKVLTLAPGLKPKFAYAR
ncbi:uncharacterized protein J3R85_002339 [Psidium guajava]|nr:uncharacterized protein J3R85_002339 [Psidium guajava]